MLSLGRVGFAQTDASHKVSVPRFNKCVPNIVINTYLHLQNRIKLYSFITK